MNVREYEEITRENRRENDKKKKSKSKEQKITIEILFK